MPVNGEWSECEIKNKIKTHSSNRARIPARCHSSSSSGSNSTTVGITSRCDCIYGTPGIQRASESTRSLSVCSTLGNSEPIGLMQHFTGQLQLSLRKEKINLRNLRENHSHRPRCAAGRHRQHEWLAGRFARDGGFECLTRRLFAMSRDRL